MKRFTIFLCAAGFLLLSATASRAADFGISPFPAHGDKPSPVDVIDAIQKVTDAGVTAALITKSWREMEPIKGVYNLQALADSINTNDDLNRNELVGIDLIDTVKRDMPDYLKDKKWDDPVVAERFDELMKHLGALLTGAPKFVSLGNDADVYFHMHPDELAGYMKFFERAQASAQRVFLGARVGITVTYEGLASGREKLIQTLLQPCTIAIFTYYPFVNTRLQPIENVGEHLDAMIKAAGDRPVVLQEVGYPSSESVGSSNKQQAFFFRTVIAAIRQRPQISFANLYMLHDFPSSTCAQMIDYYNGNDWPQDAKDRFHAFMCSLGLMSTDDVPKPAWAEVRNALKGAGKQEHK